MSDSRITLGNTAGEIVGGKLFAAGKLLYGIAGIMPPTMKPKAYPATRKGVNALAKDLFLAMVAHGHGSQDDDGIFTVVNNAIVVGPGLGPFVVGSCGEVLEYSEQYAAIGSGASLAIGAMHVAANLECNAEDALNLAMDAACTHDIFSGGTIYKHVFEPKAEPKRRVRRTTGG